MWSITWMKYNSAYSTRAEETKTQDYCKYLFTYSSVKNQITHIWYIFFYSCSFSYLKTDILYFATGTEE